MYFLYIDDSTDRPTNVFSALLVPHDKWNEAFAYIKLWRGHLRDTHRIPLYAELHATEFLSGRGSRGVLGHLSRRIRSQIFHKHFEVVEHMKTKFGVRMINVCNDDDDQFRAFERMLNRVNRTMQSWNSYAYLICDEGKELQYTRMVRRMRVHNYIPSDRGVWDSGLATKNIPIDRIIEDPRFKSSVGSYFIQLSDFNAHGLLRMHKPTPRARQFRYHRSFNQLENVLVKECNRRDPKGIIR
ncbi:MAG: DUF3800 domain-containing protein [Pseudomonadota bacterium]